MLLATLFFVVGSAIHVLLGDFPKTIDVMPDEMRYLDTARSLFSGDGLVMHGEHSSFQKILYPLSIMPALLFPDGPGQVSAINVLNSVYACSAVFPAMLIARRLFDNPVAIVASMAFTLLLPDLMYSMTFMTESVFIPLTLWLVYLCWRSFQAQGTTEFALALGSSVLCYLDYLCKEVAWMFLIAFLAWHLIGIARKRRDWQRSVMSMGLFLIGFLGPFVIMKLTLFWGLMNSYSQLTFDILLSPYTVLFGLYALATDATYFIVGFGVFPVLYVALVYRDMPREERDLAFFCLTSLLVGLAVVVFTISMREDVGHVALRQHLRYVIPLYLPLLMLFIQRVARFDPRPLRENPRRLAEVAGVTVAFCVMAVAFFGSANLKQGFDNSEFHFMRWLLELAGPLAQEYHDTWGAVMSSISTDDGDLLVVEPLNWLCRALVVAFAAMGMRLLLSTRERTRLRAGGGICAVLAAFMVANSVCAFIYNSGAYGADQAEIDEICAINEQLETRTETGQVLIVLDDGNTKNNNFVDTYIQDGPGIYSYLTPEKLLNKLNTMGVAEDDPGTVQEPIRYLLVNKRQGIQVMSDNLVQVGGLQGDEGRFLLYLVTDDEPPKLLLND